ncbi:hypothetical protein EYZ11_008491 [Aspergillus tanneri]|uniref:Uncharacterized protein n=1 Tax=Aspergillus tanneri TaxID=1220188 RepID=A0A4S3JAC1_9EURO|nr:hypothetical protein EYZ11_008491 [Aspergillus tanneri]
MNDDPTTADLPVLIEAENAEELPKPVRNEKKDNRATPKDPLPYPEGYRPYERSQSWALGIRQQSQRNARCIHAQITGCALEKVNIDVA